MKVLVADESGMWVLQKRLDRGTFAWPAATTDVVRVEYRAEQLALQFGLPAGDHDLLAVTHDGKVVCASVRIEPGTVRTPVWKLVPAGEVAGAVRDHAGNPVAGVELRVMAMAVQEVGGVRAGERQRCSVVTDRNGRFRCRGLPAGEWTITAPHDERAGTATATVVADTVQSVELAYAR